MSRCRSVAVGLMGATAWCLVLAANLGVPAAAQEQEKQKQSRPAGVAKATIFLGEFE